MPKAILRSHLRYKNHDKSESSCCSILNARSAEPRRYGGVAQLGEHLPCKQGVKGSNPFISTTKRGARWAHSSGG